MAKLKDDEIRWILSLDAKGVQSELTSISSVIQRLTDDNKKLEAELKLATRQMSEAEKEMKKLAAAGKEDSDAFREAKATYESAANESADYTKRIRDNKKAIEENDAKAKEMVKTLKLEDMTMNQLKYRAYDLQKQLDNTSKSTHPEAYKALEKELTQVNKRMGELKNGADETSSVFSGKLAKGSVAVTAAIAAAKEAFNLLEDVMMSNRATGIEFAAMMDGVANSIGYVKTALANWDFTNFVAGLKSAYKVGHQVSIMLEDAYDLENSFKMTSAREIAELEELKTQLRDVNLSNKERLRIGDEIIVRTRKMAEDEKKFTDIRHQAAKDVLVDQTKLTDAELEYITVNRIRNDQQIKDIKKIQELEGDLFSLQEKANTYQIYATGGPKVNNYYAQQLHETNKEIEDHVNLIDKLKVKYKLTDPKQYEIAVNAIKKFTLASTEAIDAYVNSGRAIDQIDIKTTQSLKMTQRTIAGIRKKNSDTTKEENKILVAERKSLSQLIQSLDTTYNNKLTKINQDYLDGKIKTESGYNQQVYALEQASYIIREQALTEFKDKVTRQEVKDDVSKRISEIQKQRLQQEINFRAKLEQIILNANPEAKEKKEYEDRLRDLGIFGKSRQELQMLLMSAETEQDKKLLQQKLDALELLEKQHQDNLLKIRNDAKAKEKARGEEKFQESFGKDKAVKQKEIEDESNSLSLQKEIGALTPTEAFDAEVELQKKRLALIQEELDARKASGKEYSNVLKEQASEEAALTKLYTGELNRRKQEYQQYGTAIGTVLGNVITGQEDALEDFADVMLDILFDTLTQMINAEIVKVVATGTGAIFRATANEIGSKGFVGIGTAAILTGILTVGMATAKSVLKGLINGGKKNVSTESKTGQRVDNPGLADGGYNDSGIDGGYTGAGGRYQVKGTFPNGVTYHAGEYVIAQPEMKIPVVSKMVHAIEGIRRQRTNSNPMPAGLADGGFNDPDMPSSRSEYSGGSRDISALDSTLNRFIALMEKIEESGLGVNYYAFEEGKKVVDRSRNGASKY
ncbi:hypothetical protein IR083_10155 [Dysgonomonas sp. GY75]|uniref:hypothetical protein n=1 Tax=Dysgonomonas sp. GY75 TaxID=2780419 RepID=UPI001884495F|nr:hypothetical protein [Dysgonomonas sp. GY75]MBF0649183.1 hypothetical protein [Dysgonomonas sp. GY75]